MSTAIAGGSPRYRRQQQQPPTSSKTIDADDGGHQQLVVVAGGAGLECATTTTTTHGGTTIGRKEARKRLRAMCSSADGRRELLRRVHSAGEQLAETRRELLAHSDRLTRRGLDDEDRHAYAQCHVEPLHHRVCELQWLLQQIAHEVHRKLRQLREQARERLVVLDRDVGQRPDDDDDYLGGGGGGTTRCYGGPTDDYADYWQGKVRELEVLSVAIERAAGG